MLKSILGSLNPLNGVKQAVNLVWLIVAVSAVSWLGWTLYSHVVEFNNRGTKIVELERVVEVKTAALNESEDNRRAEGLRYVTSLNEQKEAYVQLIASQKAQNEVVTQNLRREIAAARRYQPIIEEARNARPEDDAPAAPVLSRVLDRLYDDRKGQGGSGGGAAGGDHQDGVREGGTGPQAVPVPGVAGEPARPGS